ncbi:MAG: Cys-Gln thioester bond-forming surface protein [Lachnospiraceae bacterium]|nr:Cys-Gln thioester bond-forming surface protein [Lachnospiraceae bacterium]
MDEARRKYLLQDGEHLHPVYCAESGAEYDGGNGYVSENGTNSAYFRNLPIDARFGVMMVLMYGWHEGKASPVAGTNEDDYAFATQTIIWEYQQQLRTSPADLHDANGIEADTYRCSLTGRPAEQCYDWILERMAEHYTIPGFAARSEARAETYTLNYDPDRGDYRLTLIDDKNTLSDLVFQAEGITVSREGNRYTLVSDRMRIEPVTVTAQKKVNTGCEEMLLWGSVGKQTMVSGASDPVYCYLKIDTETYGTGRIQKTSEDGAVSGIRFHISGNGVDETVTTGEDGTAELSLMPGVYTVTELSAPYYEPQSVQRVTIVSGHTSTVVFDNVFKRGSLEVIKTSEDRLNEGVKFHLYGTSLSGRPVDEYAVTDAAGVARFEEVLISGSTPYILEEVETAERYVIPEAQTAPIEWETVTKRSFSNVLKKFRVKVTKSDEETGMAQGDASLSGAVYGLYKDGQLIDTYTTDEAGQFTTKEYWCGDDWTIREIRPSEGYLLDPTEYPVGAESKRYAVERNHLALDVKESAIRGNIALIKHTDTGETQIETPETGAVFEVYLKAAGSYEAAEETERDLLTCDENGFARTKDLPYGLYTVKQTFGWEGRELMKPFDVNIREAGKTYRYLINNACFESYIKVVKTDAETGKVIPLAGAGFQIYDPEGNPVTMVFPYPEVTEIDTFYTAQDGTLITPQTLAYGTGYSLVEVQAPYGYVLNSEPVFFDVVPENAGEESGVTVIEVERANPAQKGRIAVSKSGEILKSVEENAGFYRPVFEEAGLAGAVYEIAAAEDIYTGDGTLRAGKGEVVDTVTTGENGTAVSKELYLGRYEVRETEAPFGFVRDPSPKTVELVYAGQETVVTETAVDFYNERQRAAVELIKELEVNEAYSIGENGELFEVTFGLYAETEITAADGSGIPADGLIEMISLDENGRGIVTTDLPVGNYYVKEIAANAAYHWDDTKYPVLFTYAGPDAAVVHLVANEGEVICNPIRYGRVNGRKTDEEGKGLSGATIGIFQMGTTEFTRETAIEIVVSAEDGGFSFEEVPYGEWVIREIESPNGFILSKEEISVTVGEAGETVEIELTNRRIRGNLSLIKIDEEDPAKKLSGAVFEVYEDKNGNGTLEEEDSLSGEMKEEESGSYRMEGLSYGTYLVREKEAPEGYFLDGNLYAVSVEEDGKTYLIENRAGAGFVNVPKKGDLKITKTSSDYQVEGFSFRVTGPDGYDEVFQTDRNGEIFLEGLRIGDYSVSEVSDSRSAAYLLPADKTVIISTGMTAAVSFHNERRMPPATGDASAPGFWLCLAGASTACAVFGGRRFLRKKNS